MVLTGCRGLLPADQYNVESNFLAQNLKIWVWLEEWGVGSKRPPVVSGGKTRINFNVFILLKTDQYQCTKTFHFRYVSIRYF